VRDRADVDPAPIAPTVEPPLSSSPPSDEVRNARSALRIFGGLYGLSLAIGLIGASGPEGDGGGEVLLALASAGAGAYLAHRVVRNREITQGQSMAVMSGATFGTAAGIYAAWLGQAPDDSASEPFFAGSAIGGLVGLGAGVWIATKKPDAGDVAFANSLGSYGMVGGLLLGLAMDPAQDRAYGMNALVGTLGGLGVGALLSRKVDVSRRRMAYVDLGVGLGVLTGVIIVGGAMGDDADAGRMAGASALAFGALGGVVTWYGTRKLDKKRNLQTAARPPALFSRGADGAWGVGLPLPRPVARTGADTAWGVDLVSGAW
jgi:hypothetical protein